MHENFNCYEEMSGYNKQKTHHKESYDVF
jgi:hypothetical protein